MFDNGLSQLPAGAVTAVGSLPMTDPERAVGFVGESSPQWPAWPQLPQRDTAEGMIEQALRPLAPHLERGVSGWGFRVRAGQLDSLLGRLHEAPAALDAESAAGFFAFEQAAEGGRFDSAAALKGQVIGPATLSLCLSRGPADRPFADHPQLLKAVARYVGRLAAWQAQRLGRFGRPVTISIDEPAIGVRPNGLGASFPARAADAAQHALDAVRDAGGIAALHCCGTRRFGYLGAVDPDVFSFDAYHGLAALCRSEAARDYVQRGGRLAFGLVPTLDRPAALKPRTLFMQWLHAALDLGDVGSIARRSFITASCGLGLLDRRAAVESFGVAREVGDLVARAAACPPRSPRQISN